MLDYFIVCLHDLQWFKGQNGAYVLLLFVNQSSSFD